MEPSHANIFMSPPPKEQVNFPATQKSMRRLFMTPEHGDMAQEDRQKWVSPVNYFTSSKTQSSPLFKEMVADRFIPFRNTNTVSRLLFDLPDKAPPKPLKSGGNSNAQTPSRPQPTSLYNPPASRDNNMNEEEQPAMTPEQQNQQIYNCLLEQNLLHDNNSDFDAIADNNENEAIAGEGHAATKPQSNKLLTFHKLEPTNLLATSSHGQQISSFDSLFSSMSTSMFTAGKTRKINHVPFKVLDAPELRDDFYLNLMDWSTTNLLAVSLSDSLYLWQGDSGKVETLCNIKDARDPMKDATNTKILLEDNTAPNDFFSSVQWNSDGVHLAAGTQAGLLTVWDASTKQRLFTSERNKSRVGCLSWNPSHPSLLLTGSRDTTIQLWDFRTPENVALEFKRAHRLEVCNVQWAASDPNRFASGGNDNKLLVWNILKPEKFDLSLVGHKAAVKGLAWSPHQAGLLVSGGGTRDTSIKVWNTVTGSLLNEVVTGSQVCSLAFSKTVNEIATGLGFVDNQVVFWKLPSLTKVAVLEAHAQRVLYLCLSPNGQYLASGSGDQTIKIWDAFPASKPSTLNSSLEFSNMQLR